MTTLNMQLEPSQVDVDVTDLKRELKTLKKDKGLLGKRVGELKRADQSAEKEIESLALISKRINELSKTLKKRLNNSTNTVKDAGTNLGTTTLNLSTEESEESKAFDLLKKQTVSNIVRFNGDKELAQKVDDFVDMHPEGTIYHKSALFNFIDKTFAHDRAFLVALNNDAVIGLLPLVRLNSPLFGNFIVSVPYFNYGGILSNNPDTAKLLVAEASQWKNTVNASHIEFRHTEKDIVDLPCRTDKVTFILPLPQNKEDLWASFKPKLRAQIKRSSRLSPSIKIGRNELLDDFYHVFSINMRDLGTPVYGKDFFSNALDSFGDAAKLIVIYLNDKPVACAFLLGFKETLEIPWASTLKEFNPVGINMTMYWEILTFAIRQGYSNFDFGRCTKDCGTYKFKKQWGAQPIPFYWHYSLPDGEQLPQLNPNNPKFKLLVAVWKRLPVALTKLIGPHVVKYLP